VVVLVEEKSVVEDQEMENMDCFVETIHMVCRKLKHVHYCWGCMQGWRVNSYFVERSGESWVPMGVHPMVEGE
jgi:hypothetical protein